MDIFNTALNHADPQTAENRVKVNLKTLIDLGEAAAIVNLQHASKVSMQSGGYNSHFKGRGMEFDESRLYQPGDDIRSIDWRVTARTGKPHTKVFREERERPVFISVDYRPTMIFATRGVFKSVQAAKLAALLAWAAQQQGDRIGGQIFNHNGCQELKPQNGKHAVLRFLKALVSPQVSSTAGLNFDHVLVRLNQHARPGSRVIIISDFRNLNNKAEKQLAKLSRHCEVIMLQLFDHLESHLPTKGRYRFTDGRRDIVIDAADTQKINHYQLHFQQRCLLLQQLSLKLRLIWLQCSTTDNPVEVLR